jgi:hypothetical protein
MKKGQSDEPKQDLVVFKSNGDQIELAIDKEHETMWASQQKIASYFGCTERNISDHIRNIYKEGELDKEATQKKNFLVQVEGTRSVRRTVTLYNLDVIISIGYKVNSVKATKFRQWATTTLKTFLTGGFVINKRRLEEDPEAFKQLAAALRAIRLSEQSLYQKVKDVFATSAVDYNSNSKAAQKFFAMAQDKFHYAITHKTAAQIILERADAKKNKLGLVTMSGDQPTSVDVTVAKNYLNSDELQALENISDQFLLFAESKAFRGQKMTMEEITTKLNNILGANDYPILYQYESFERGKANQHADRQLQLYRARLKGNDDKKRLNPPQDK